MSHSHPHNIVMTFPKWVRIWGQPLRHIYDWKRSTPTGILPYVDGRIGWTKCGIRFAWGDYVPREFGKAGKCSDCQE